MSGFAGVSTDSAHTGPLLGGAVGWEVTSRLAIEGNGAWAEFGDGTNAFSGAMKVRVRIAGKRTVDPFLQGGVGLYRATFGANETRIPTFYRHRMTNQFAPEGAATTFTDPTVVGGGGINFFVNRHLALRPDVEAALVIRNRQHHLVTTVAFHAVFHFENHPVTPAFRR